MGVYIKDMKMPKVPGVYSLDLYVDEICQIQNLDGETFEASYIENVKLSDCPLTPVVLCKDCMYAPSGTDGGEDRGFDLEWPHDDWPEYNPCPCKCGDGWYSHKPNPEFYCAYGKKEEK